MKDIFINIKNKTRQVAISNEVLGIIGENCQGNIVIDFAGDFIDGVGWLETQYGDTKGFVVLTKDSTNKTYSLPIKSCLLTKAGEVKFQIRITQNKVADEIPIFKSDIFKLLVLDSINAVNEIPEEYPEWIDIATAKIEELDSKVDTLDEDLQSEVSNRQTADETLQGNITAEAEARKTADNDLQSQITTNAGAISSEKTARESADQTLQNNKVDKVDGKGLSTNDFTNDFKTQVENNTTARHSHSNKALLDTYDQTNANIKDAITKKHSHSNKEVLDNTTASYTTAEQTKLAGLENYNDAEVKQSIADEVSARQSADTNLQTQIDGKQATITGGATTITSDDLTASRALVSNSNGKVAVSDITSTELGYLDGVTSNIQTQLNGKQASLSTAQQNAVNSGITSSLVTQIGTNKTNIANKVDKVTGKGLSTNDFTTAYKNQIDTNTSNIANKLEASNIKAGTNITVSTSGNDVTINAETGEGGTNVYVGSVKQDSVSFDSDPQTQIDGTVKTSGDQSIAGTKNFTGKIKGSSAYFPNGFGALGTESIPSFTFSDAINVGMELGRRDGTAGTPYIDFHTDGSSSTDFNARMLASGNALNITATGGLLVNGTNVGVNSYSNNESGYNGYIRYDNGLQIVWGRVSGNNKTFYYPASFKSSSSYAVSGVSEGWTGSYANYGMSSLTATSFYLNADKSASWDYLAIGFWK